ncbi:MAG: sensor histidine kinase [Opitutaceae bacterium]|nr:sensor histidine kinase [Opitutaceae bacterium]
MASVEVEITEIPALSPGESSLLDMHSLLNVLNVLYGELSLLGLTLGDDPELLQPALAACDRFRADLGNAAASLRHAQTLPETVAAIQRVVAEELDRRPARKEESEVRDSLANLQSVFKVLDVRSREILARSRTPGEWVDLPIEDLRADFREVFAAIEKNSRGRYRIIYNLARQEAADYFINFDIESANPSVVSMPLIFKDVMRDLMANARKYTPPGGTINAGLYETAETLKFSVQDTGRGIPAEELQTVVHYGKRGSNVGQVRTLGGGFGLTKAFLVTKQFGGRFWIRSEVGIGTRIRIEIPRPTAKTQSAA